MRSKNRKKLAVLISGRGSNMEAILKASKQDDYGAEITLVLSDNKNAKGIETAKKAGIEVKTIPRGNFPDKVTHEQAFIDVIKQRNCDIVVLAGFMRLLSSKFVDAFKGRLINIHPSLLPAYKGLDTHRRVLSDGGGEHGCTVHFVNEEMDGGIIIDQARIKVETDDDEVTLSSRVLEHEHKLYPRVIDQIANGVIVFDHIKKRLPSPFTEDEKITSTKRNLIKA